MCRDVGGREGTVPPGAVRAAVAVFGPERLAPGEVVVDLDEVVVAQDGVLGLHAAEEVHHALFEFLLEAGDVAGGVDL